MKYLSGDRPWVRVFCSFRSCEVSVESVGYFRNCSKRQMCCNFWLEKKQIKKVRKWNYLSGALDQDMSATPLVIRMFISSFLLEVSHQSQSIIVAKCSKCCFSQHPKFFQKFMSGKGARSFFSVENQYLGVLLVNVPQNCRHYITSGRHSTMWNNLLTKLGRTHQKRDVKLIVLANI